MKINMLDMNQLIIKTKAQEVANPIFFDTGAVPRADGLFSYEIFGLLGTPERKTKLGFIDLKGKFLNPIAYKAMRELDSKIDSCIQGSEYYKIVNGSLVQDDNGDTGIDWLYEVYDTLVFRKNDSRIRSEKIDMLKNTPKEKIFIDKWMVIPAFYRDFNPNANSSGEIEDTEEINNMYSSIIRMVDSISNNSFGFIANSTKYSVQNILYQIYKKLTSNELSKKNGMIQKSLLGKSVDNSVRSVISSPKINSNKWDEMQIQFGYLGLPLSQLVALFLPFFNKYIIDFIELHKTAFMNAPPEDKALTLEEVYEQYDDKKIKNIIEYYIKDPNSRFDNLYVVDKAGKKYKVKLFEENLGRPFTVIDLLYLAAVDICEDKHVMYSRYPIENFRAKCFLISN